MSAFSDFYMTIRLMLGDLDPNQLFQYQDATLAGAIRAVFLMGRGPTGFTLDGDRNTTTNITPDIPTGNEFAIISLEAALLLVGGDVGANSYRTRALSVSESGDRKRDLLTKIRTEIYAIAGGDGFATQQSFLVWITSLTDFRELIGVDAGPATALTVGSFPIIADLTG
jgi:hypothetical protein